jgi:4-amino-4-deoxychorismate lyase
MILINGQPGEHVSALDRGLHYGDGLFETLAVRDGEPQLLERHLHQLADGCRRLHLPAPDAAVLTREARQLCAGASRAVLKIVVTRGQGTRGYRITPADTATTAERGTRILMLLPAPQLVAADYRDGIALRLCHARLGTNPALAGIKHLNRLEQVLARAEWDDPEIREGLMLDATGAVIEGTMSNLFVVRASGLLTPELSQCGVAGVMRGLIIDTAQALGIPVSVTRVLPEYLAAADEVFMSNSLIGIWPVQRIEQTEYVVGPVTRRLMAEVSRHSLMEMQ